MVAIKNAEMTLMDRWSLRKLKRGATIASDLVEFSGYVAFVSATIVVDSMLELTCDGVRVSADLLNGMWGIAVVNIPSFPMGSKKMLRLNNKIAYIPPQIDDGYIEVYRIPKDIAKIRPMALSLIAEYAAPIKRCYQLQVKVKQKIHMEIEAVNHLADGGDQIFIDYSRKVPMLFRKPVASEMRPTVAK